MKRITIAITIFWSLACSGAVSTDDASQTDAEEPEEVEEPEEEEEEPADPKEMIVGSWQLVPGEAAMRNYQVMRAAASGKDKAKEKLGKLDSGEQGLFDYVKAKSAAEKKSLLEYIAAVRSTRYVFEDDGDFVIEVEDKKIADGDYTIEDADEDSMHVSFETYTVTHWYIKWKGDNGADVDVRMGDSDLKIAHRLKRR